MSKSILIVDDFPMMRTALRMVLERSKDLRVCGEAGDGEEALRKARELNPDLVILDLEMPRLNGIATASALKQTMPSIKIAFCTLYAETGQKFAPSLGVDCVVAKSNNADHIIEQVQSVLNSEEPS